MKKIIFSIYNDNVDQNNISTNSYKLNQFRKYSKQLEHAQREYAKKCDAEYVLHRLDITDYTELQFQKIRQLELYAEDYDQVLYLDFDVVPHKRAENIFDVYGDTLAIYSSHEHIEPRELKWFIEKDTFDSQNKYCKAAAKNSMLIIDNCQPSLKIYNTGVFYGSSKVLKQLQFDKRLIELKELLDEAKDDSLYPDNISKNFSYNNEVFVTYLIEKYNILCTDMNIQWNYILDGFQTDPPDTAYFTHHVNKSFEISFPEKL